jgi:hypothetical protein
MSCISSVEDWYKALFINTQYDFALLEEPFYILKCYEYCTPFRQQPKAGTPSPLGQVKVLGRGFDGYYQNRFNLIFFYFDISE